MSDELVDRMKIVNDENGAPARYSAAHQAAAKRNGALSRGPVTAAGKARSSGNALKHGLFARHFAPPGDTREHDKLFHSIRARLVDEFQPETISQWRQVDAMAHDYVNLARVRKMIELLQRPTPLQPDDAEKWQKVQDTKKDIRLLTRVIAQAENRDNFACSQKDATRCAKFIRGLGEQFMQDLAEMQQAGSAATDEADKKEGGQTESPDSVNDEKKKAQKAICIRMGDDGFPWYEGVLDLVAILRGIKPVSGEFQMTLAQGLKSSLERAQQIVKFNSSVLRLADELSDARILSLADSPEKLMLLYQYQRKIECSIERKEGALRRQRR